MFEYFLLELFNFFTIDSIVYISESKLFNNILYYFLFFFELFSGGLLHTSFTPVQTP